MDGWLGIVVRIIYTTGAPCAHGVNHQYGGNGDTTTLRLNKVRLAGFKSFVDPTSVTLPGNLTGVVGTLEVQVDALGILSGKFRVKIPGNFSFRVASLTAQVPNVVNVSAQGIAITYNPAGPTNQQLVVINSAAISFPELNLAGVIQPVTTATGTVPMAGPVARRWPTASRRARR